MESERLYRIISVNGTNKRQCLSCERLFNYKQDLVKHAANVHNLVLANEDRIQNYKEVIIAGKKKYECNVCCRHFVAKQTIARHINNEHATGVTVLKQPSRITEQESVRQNHSLYESGGYCSDISDLGSPSEIECEYVVSGLGSPSDSESVVSDKNSDHYNALSEQSSSESVVFSSDIASYKTSEYKSSSDSEFDRNLSDYSSHDDTDKISSDIKDKFSANEIQSLKIVSCFQKHNLTGSACKDILNTFRGTIEQLLPNSESVDMFSIDGIYSAVGVSNFKEIHYCEICGHVFPENPDEFRCTSVNCNGLRYKGSQPNQNSSDRQPRRSFVISDIQTQLTTLLQTPGILQDIKKCKSLISLRKNGTVITDITDGSEYRRLLDGFLADSAYNLTAILNTDGINLYSSSKVELWPFFIAINELSPSIRFSRDNLLLAAIWQGKGKPPFEIILQHLGRELDLLYNEGIKIKIHSDIIIAKLAVVCGVFDLPAKASILNMTYFNGAESCISCEDPGIVVKQGKGHTRCYPYRDLGQEFKERVHGEVVEHMRNGTDRKRIKGFKGTSGLLAIQSYDLVQSTVPDYMHGVLLGVTQTLLMKWFSPSQSGQPYFIGKHIQAVSKCLLNIKPPLHIERLPRNLEKHFASLKATELQMWLLFYGGPCLTGILSEEYLTHFAHFSEAIYILLGDSISVDQIQRADSLLREFYSSFKRLYGQGSCGLNVHNACVHLIRYVEKWGPLWAWSCFPFEDANAALLQSVHGTGNVTRQVLRYKHTESIIRAIDIRTPSDGTLWKTKRKSDNCDICGLLKPFLKDKVSEQVLSALSEFVIEDTDNLKIVDRVRIDGKQFCSKKYRRLLRRISYIICYQDNGQHVVGSLQYFIYSTARNLVYAVIQKFVSNPNQSGIGKHLFEVKATNLIQIVPVDKLIDTVVYINARPEEEFIALFPSSHGHAILK